MCKSCKSKFKIGDKVRVKGYIADYNGVEGVVTDAPPTACSVIIKCTANTTVDKLGFLEKYLELIEQGPDFPADWSIERAIQERISEGGYTPLVTLGKVKTYPAKFPNTVAFARYIEKHEQPPVAPELLAAREFAASRTHTTSTKKGYLEGRYDNASVVLAFIGGISWQKEHSK